MSRWLPSDPNLTASPTSFEAINNSFNAGGGKITIQLSYLGTGEISVSGEKPYHTTLIINRTQKTVAIQKGSYNYYQGNATGTITISLSGSAGYSPATTEVKFRISSEGEYITPITSDDIHYEE